ncbi:MAG: HlyD family secretion protein [Pirellulaceae bacterium]
MYDGTLVDLADCTEFRQTLVARPPRVVHGAALLSIALLAAAVTWAAVVEANLVVRAAGRLRTVEIPTRIYTSACAELDGRVVEAPFVEGDAVRCGDTLVVLDTQPIDNQIAKLQRTIDGAEEELHNLAVLHRLTSGQFATARQKAEAERVQAEVECAMAKERRASDIRRAEAELEAAEADVQRNRQLMAAGAISDQDRVTAETELRRAQEKLVQAKLDVDESPVAVARQHVELVDREFAVRQAEIETRQVAKQGEAEVARQEMARLNRARQNAVLRSPIDGVIVAGQVRAGDVVEPGKPVLEVARQQSYQFEALVPSEDVGHLRIGMPVDVKFDAYDYQKHGVMKGRVTYLSPDSKVSKNVDSTTQEGYYSPASGSPSAAFVVRVVLQGEEIGRGALRSRLKLGLTGTAEIVTGRESVLEILVKRIRQSVSLG